MDGSNGRAIKKARVSTDRMVGGKMFGLSRLVVVVVALTGSAAFVATAAADPVSPPTVRHRLGLDVGLASAVGSVGATYQFAPAPWLRLEAGVGWGPTGTQLSGMPKLAFGGQRCRFVAGFGASVAIGGGEATASQSSPPAAIPWLNVDAAGLECHTARGFSFHGALGLTTPLVDFRYEIADVGDTVRAWELLPQGRIGVGWWF
jgi:hypothetical protein